MTSIHWTHKISRNRLKMLNSAFILLIRRYIRRWWAAESLLKWLNSYLQHNPLTYQYDLPQSGTFYLYIYLCKTLTPKLCKRSGLLVATWVFLLIVMSFLQMLYIPKMYNLSEKVIKANKPLIRDWSVEIISEIKKNISCLFINFNQVNTKNIDPKDH